MARHPFFMTKLPENEEDFTPELEGKSLVDFLLRSKICFIQNLKTKSIATNPVGRERNA